MKRQHWTPGAALLVFSSLLVAAAAQEGWEHLAILGRALANQGKYREARDTLESAHRQAERFGSFDARLAAVLNDLGTVYAHLGEISVAERCYRRSAAIWEQRGDTRNAFAPLTNLTGVYLARRQYQAAESLLRESLNRAMEKFGPDHPYTSAILTYLARLAFSRHDYAAAAELGERVLDALRKTRGPDDPQVATALDNLGTIYQAQKRTT
jgi:tetratricopeptide (TPR) repeat protein